MINELSLKFGASPEGPPLKFDPGRMTVIVGPNFSGKSKLIREIQHAVTQGFEADDNVILERLKLEKINADEVDSKIEAVRLDPNPGETVNPEHVIVGRLGQRHKVIRSQLKHSLVQFDELDNGNAYRQQAARWYFSARTQLLNAESRIGLTNDQHMGDLSHSPQSTLQLLFADDELREKVRKIVADAFGLYLVVDPTNGGQLRLRISERPPVDTEEERSLSKRAVDFHRSATLLSQASDGTRAFCGILIEVMAGNPDLLLLDEPEAFLHPGLSYKLGLEMARQVQNSTKNVIVSTHSANFLMGCVSAGIDVNVVRLTFKNGDATARLLPAADLRLLMRNPLLRSANVLSGLFYENVVVCEADTDRAFYQEINHRLNREDRGMVNALFINANGKGAMPTIIEPLKRLGVTVSAIYDLDFMKDGGSVLTSRLDAAQVPEQLRGTIRSARTELDKILKSKPSDYKRSGGIALLDDGEMALFESMDDILRKYGVFLVRVGEVEGWLRDGGVGGHGTSWLVDMFDYLGVEETSEYINPSDDDVWKFIEHIGGSTK